LNIQNSQGNAATDLGEVADDITAFYPQFIAKCNSERIIKIGLYLPQLLQKRLRGCFVTA